MRHENHQAQDRRHRDRGRGQDADPQIAEKLGIKIPTLCHHPILEPYGVCRICTVEVRSRQARPHGDGVQLPRDQRDRGPHRLGAGPARPEDDHRVADGALRPRPGPREAGGRVRHHRAAVRPRRRRLHPVRPVRARLLGHRRRQRARVLQPRHHARGLDGLRRDLGEVHRLRGLRLCLPDRSDQDRERRGAGPRGAAARAADAHQHPLHAGGPAPAGHRPRLCIHFKTGGCKVCEKVCEPKAIDHTQQDQIEEIEVGAVILATGLQVVRRAQDAASTATASTRTSSPAWSSSR